jgi:hypothetical protein
MGVSETGAWPVTPARLVLDTHISLYEAYKSPGEKLRWYTGQFMQDTMDEAERQNVPQAWGYMFWPARTGEEFTSLIARQLYVSPTYQVTAEMVDAVTGTYENVVSRIGHIEERDLPTPSGFAWLDKPMGFPDDKGITMYRAVSWSSQPMEFMSGFREEERWAGVRVSCWAVPEDNLQAFPGDTVAELRKLGPLVLAHSAIIPFGQRFATRKLGEDPATMDDAHRWAHCLWLWLQAEITVTRAAPPEDVGRGARRRAQRSLKHDRVNVVILRRASKAADPSGLHRDVDWSCRWPVQGHDRHLDKYEGPRHHAIPRGPDKRCAACDSRTTYVHAFIKGPEGLPLKSAEQLYRLAR